MNIATLPAPADLVTALQNLADAGIEFAVICSGPEPTRPDWQIASAA